MGVTVDNGSGTDYSPRTTNTGGAGTVSGDEVQHVVEVAQAATVANVAQSAAAVTLLASNAKRAGFVVENDSENHVADLFVKFGSGASLTSYTRRVPPGTAWERRGGYVGVITGIWSAAGAGNARVTEETL